MKAIVQDRYGSVEGLRIDEIAVPVLAADEVLVRVHAAGLNHADTAPMRSEPLVLRLAFGVLFTRSEKRFELIFDMAGSHSLNACRRVSWSAGRGGDGARFILSKPPSTHRRAIFSRGDQHLNGRTMGEMVEQAAQCWSSRQDTG